MFTTAYSTSENGIYHHLQIQFKNFATGQETETNGRFIQRKLAYIYFVENAAEYLRWASDQLYQKLQAIHMHYFDRTKVPYFGVYQSNWTRMYWIFLECRDRVRRYPDNINELAKSYAGKDLRQLIPEYHFPERAEIIEAVADIEKLSVEIIATIKKLSRETSLPVE